MTAQSLMAGLERSSLASDSKEQEMKPGSHSIADVFLRIVDTAGSVMKLLSYSYARGL